MKERVLIVLLIIVFALTGCAQSEPAVAPATPMEDDSQKISIVNNLFSAYLESYKEDSEDRDIHDLGKILSYTIDEIDIMDSEFTERMREGDPLSRWTEDVIFADVQFTVTPDPDDEKSMDWNIPAGDFDGVYIHCFRVLFIDKVDGEYQIVDMGSGW